MFKMTDAEWKIMKVLWAGAPRTMIQITNELKAATGWTKHTVMSFLKRMEDKKVLHFEEGERAKLYYPDILEKEAVLQETEEFLGKVFQGRVGLMLNAMVQQHALTKEEIEELHRILESTGEEK